MRHALVTGATGGLGRVLTTHLLAAGYRVRATGRDDAAGAELAAQGAEFVAGDIIDPQVPQALVRGVDAVFHAAALSSPWGPRALFEAVNLTATERLLAAARRAGCDAFVYVSTPSVYAEPRDRLGLTEESPLAARFANAYVATKHAAERAVLAADAPGFATLALRPRAVVGPHDRTLLPRLARVARTGRFPLFRQGMAQVDVTDARDVAEALIAADRARGQLGGRVFNISGGAPRSVIEILRAAFAALELSPRLARVPYGLAAGACAGMEAVYARLPGRPEPPATVYSLTTLAFSQTFDLTAARRDLDWTPRHSPEDAIQWAAGAGTP